MRIYKYPLICKFAFANVKKPTFYMSRSAPSRRLFCPLLRVAQAGLFLILHGQVLFVEQLKTIKYVYMIVLVRVGREKVDEKIRER